MKYLLFAFVLPFFFCASNNDKKENSIKNGTSIDGIIDVVDDASPFALIQLFTSQGCSSCPSADTLLEEVKKEYPAEEVAVLSYHVDYWNRLGWKDPFSSSVYTALQNRYASKFNSSNLYTPQAVINGNVHFVGSNKTKMNVHLDRSLQTNATNKVSISSVEKEGDAIYFSYSVAGTFSDRKLKIALAISQRVTPIKRGENGGRSLKNSNIVVEEISVANKAGDAFITIPSLVKGSDELLLIAYIQKKDLEITGGTQTSID